MDPASIIGITTSSTTLLKLLGEGVVSVKSMVQGIRKVDETTQYLSAEVDAFQSTLGVLQHELGRCSTSSAVQQFWNPVKLDGLLVNAAKTFSRLEEIYGEISRQRSGLRKVREYLRTTYRQEELQHLRARITIYTTALNIPAVLFAIQGIRTSPSAFDQSVTQEIVIRRINRLEQRIESLPLDIQHDISDNLTNLENTMHRISAEGQEARDETVPALHANLQAVTASLSEVLGNRISQLEENISNISTDLRSLVARQGDTSTSMEVSTERIVSRDSEELIEIASGIVSRASTVTASARSIATASTRSTIRPEGPRQSGTPPSSAASVPGSEEARPESMVMDSSLSVIGVPISTNRREAIRAWISDTGSPSTHGSRRATGSRDLRDSASVEDASTESDLLFTPPPSTTVGHQDDDIEVEIARRRWNLAQSLLVEGKNENAVPHLRRVLRDLEGLRIRPDRWNRTDIQFLLAKTMMETSFRDEADGLFRTVSAANDSNPLKRATAAHFVASSLTEKDTDEAMEEAKSYCMTAIQMRKRYLGAEDPATQSSVVLMRDICRTSSDPDGDIWNSMLPQSLQVTAPRHSARIISTFPGSIHTIRASAHGNLVVQSYDSVSYNEGKSVIRLFDRKDWKMVKEATCAGYVSVTIADETLRFVVAGQYQNMISGVRLYQYCSRASPINKLSDSSADPIPGLYMPVEGVRISLDGSKIFWYHPNACGFTIWGSWVHRTISTGVTNFPVTPMLAESVDGSVVASRIGPKVHVWNQSDNYITRSYTFNSEVTNLTCSQSNAGLLIYCANSSVHFVRLPAGGSNSIFSKQEGVTAMALSRNDKLLALAKAGNIELWEFPPKSDKPIDTLRVRGANGIVTTMTFSPSGKAIWAGYSDGTLRVWTLIGVAG